MKLLLPAIIFLVTAISSANAAEARVLDGVAARVNDDVITFSQVRELTGAIENAAYANLAGDALTKRIAEVRMRAINDLVDRQLIVQEFRKMKASIPPHVVDDRITAIVREDFGGDRAAFLRTISAQGLTLEKIRKMEEEKVIVGAMRSREVKGDPIITPAAIEAFYRANIEQWTTGGEVKLRMIKIVAGADPVKNRALIQKIRADIVGGKDFGDMARIYSQDSTQDANGDWGWVKRGDMSPDMERVIFSLPKGKVSDVIELNQTFYLMIAEDKKGGVVKPLAELRGDIERRLAQVEKQKQQQVWLERLRKRAYIKIF